MCGSTKRSGPLRRVRRGGLREGRTLPQREHAVQRRVRVDRSESVQGAGPAAQSGGAPGRVLRPVERFHAVGPRGAWVPDQPPGGPLPQQRPGPDLPRKRHFPGRPQVQEPVQQGHRLQRVGPVRVRP